MGVPMSDNFQLGFQFNIDDARKKANNEREHRAITTAEKFLATDITSQYYMSSVFALTSLPHSKPKDDRTWVHKNGHFNLLIEGGNNLIDGKPEYSGVPYGSRARLILFYLITKAVESDDPQVHLGNTMTAWMKSMNIPLAGKNYENVREQVRRITACRMAFEKTTDEGSAMARKNIIEAMFIPGAGSSRTWEETAVLSEGFFESLKRHNFPVDAAAISTLQSKSQAMDVYIWLCYRFKFIEEATLVPWKSLYEQFGHGYSQLRYFKRKFLSDVLPIAVGTYPEAKLEIDDKQGIILHPSPLAIKTSRLYRGGTIKSISGGK